MYRIKCAYFIFDATFKQAITAGALFPADFSGKYLSGHNGSWRLSKKPAFIWYWWMNFICSSLPKRLPMVSGWPSNHPFSTDLQRLVSECMDGVSQVHYINPKGCVHPKGHNLSSRSAFRRPCTVLLPRQIQVWIAFPLLLVFHFWNKNRTIE